MAAWIYEISLRVFKKYFMSERSDRVKYFQHETRNFESPRGHEISSIYDMCCQFVKVNDQFITFQDYLVNTIPATQGGEGGGFQSCLSHYSVCIFIQNNGPVIMKLPIKFHQGARTIIIFWNFSSTA